MAQNNSYSRTVSLKLVGFNDEDKSKFESIFAIAESRLDVPWQIVSTVESDFYLLSHRLRGQMDQNSLLRSLPRKRCIFYATKESNSEEHELLVGSDSMPSLRALVILFNALSATTDTDAEEPVEIQLLTKAKDSLPSPEKVQDMQGKDSTSPEEKNDSSSTIDNTYFDLEQGFIGLLLTKKTGIYRLDFESNSIPAILYINLEGKVYYSQDKLEQLNSFFSSEQVISKTLSDSVLQKDVETKGLKPQSLSNLIWYAVFSCSQGRARKGYQKPDIVHLKRWPDINLPGCRELIKLAAFMQSNAVELSVAQKKTGFSMQQVYNFYNACYAIGLVEQVQQTDTFEKQLSDDRRQLFSKIGKRLNQAK